jgi:hypothetical protein
MRSSVDRPAVVYRTSLDDYGLVQHSIEHRSNEKARLSSRNLPGGLFLSNIQTNGWWIGPTGFSVWKPDVRYDTVFDWYVPPVIVFHDNE